MRYFILTLSLVLLILAVLVVSFFIKKEQKQADNDHPNVLLIVVDTLRADHLACYGYRLPTSPHIDKLAEQGVRFSDCMAQWSSTLKSMSSFMTGLYPTTGGFTSKAYKLPSYLIRMGDIFHNAGYNTGAVVANVNVGKVYGFDQGFDGFVESWREKWEEEEGNAHFVNRPGLVKKYTNATIVTDQALAWLGQRDKQKPFFLWLHYMDPHGPYIPPKEYLDYFKKAHPSQSVPITKLPNHQVQYEEDTNNPITDLGFYKAQYDREIRYVDNEIGRLLDSLKRMDLDQKLLVILTADHGESMGEHDYYLAHRRFAYQTLGHVPLIMVQEGLIPGGKVIEHPVGLIDVTPTIVKLAGLKVPPVFEGQKLHKLIKGHADQKGPKYVFMGIGPHRQRAIRHGRWRLIHGTSEDSWFEKDESEFALFDIRNDPLEKENVAFNHGDVVRRLSSQLEHWSSNRPVIKKPDIAPGKVLLDEKSREMLKSLGYIN